MSLGPARYKRKSLVAPSGAGAGVCPAKRLRASVEAASAPRAGDGGADLDFDIDDVFEGAATSGAAAPTPTPTPPPAPAAARTRGGPLHRAKTFASPASASLSAKAALPPSGDPSSQEGRYAVSFAKNTSKKHKSFDPGTMRCLAMKIHLYDENEKEVASCFKPLKEWVAEEELVIGGFVVTVDGPEVVPGTAATAASASSARAPLVAKVSRFNRAPLVRGTNHLSVRTGVARTPEPRVAAPAAAAAPVAPENAPDMQGRYAVSFAKNTSKKHKSFDPGTMRCLAMKIHLYDENEKEVASCFKPLKEWVAEEELVIGGFVVTVDGPELAPSAAAAAATPLPVAAVRSLQDARTRGTGGPRRAGARGKLGCYSLRAEDISADAMVLAEKADGGTAAYLEAGLSRRLRAHQREGVRRLWDVTTGTVSKTFQGVVLADEMGLGKTLQCIALVQAHLKNRVSDVTKAVIVTPTSLVENWAREFKKWLPHASYRSQPTVLRSSDKKTYTESKIRCFVTSDVCPVLILSYELCRSYAKALSGVPCGLLLCDEGHRLKGCDTQVFGCLNRFATKRKVLITGTPVQNDLVEYYTIFEFVNPGLLGERASFRRRYVHSKGEAARAASEEELKKMTAPYILRRTQASIASTLPPKTELVLFVKPSVRQAQLYQRILVYLASGVVDPLLTIHLLKKVLLDPALVAAEVARCERVMAEKGFAPPEAAAAASVVDGKLQMIATLLRQFASQGHKTVVVSSSVEVLQTIEEKVLRGGCARLDGSVPAARRMELVDAFNDRRNPLKVLLLSCKAGGVGLNLVGGSRLILADMDWNPANDLQAVARIWREGQTRPCRVYRLVVRGTLEERILQRQLAKMHLSNCMIRGARTEEAVAAAAGRASKWSLEQARRLFEYTEQLPCTTFCSVGTAGAVDLPALIAGACGGEDPCVTPGNVTYVKTLTDADVDTHIDVDADGAAGRAGSDDDDAVSLEAASEAPEADDAEGDEESDAPCLEDASGDEDAEGEAAASLELDV